MGQGGHITLVNGTKYDWSRTLQHSYQMNNWDFPQTIPAGSQAWVYVEWDQGFLVTESEDTGQVTYSLDGTDHNFQVQGQANNGFDLRVQLTNLSTPTNPQGSTIDLGWRHDGTVIFVLAGEEGRLISTNTPSSWMHFNLDVWGDRPLRELCFPGSHDAGMSEVTASTVFGNRTNTVTQSLPILGQLQSGARYFDIRPAISGGKFSTGHYSCIDQLGHSWQGACGRSIQAIIDDVNKFTADNRELVILYLSADLNTDVGNSSYRPFTQEEWNRLLQLLTGLNHRFVMQNPGNVDLTTLPLNTFIGNSAAVVVVVCHGSEISLGSYLGQGFYESSNFPVFNRYSNTNNLDSMAADQLAKMAAQRPNPSAGYFLLSWTLTLDDKQAAFGTTSILELANQANGRLYDKLYPACSDRCFPNVIYIDNTNSSNVAALAISINYKAAHWQFPAAAGDGLGLSRGCRRGALPEAPNYP